MIPIDIDGKIYLVRPDDIAGAVRLVGDTGVYVTEPEAGEIQILVTESRQ
jgi:hypothetical protein